MSIKPLIGITPSQQNEGNKYILSNKYTQAILQSGGLPVILPITDGEDVMSDYIDRIDGLLLSGGVDPDPLIYGEEPLSGMGSIDPERDLFEIGLIKMALRKKISILGICRGCQILNVATGGTLIQSLERDKDNVFKHIQDAPRWHPTHNVILEDNSILAKLFGTKKIKVNSFHHQAIKEVSPDFKVSARAEDGVIEAIEKIDGEFVLGVQWHPEAMWEKNNSFLKIFKEFIILLQKI